MNIYKKEDFNFSSVIHFVCWVVNTILWKAVLPDAFTLSINLLPLPSQACRLDGGTSGRAGHHWVHRLRSCVHSGAQDTCRHVYSDFQILCGLVWQDPGTFIHRSSSPSSSTLPSSKSCNLLQGKTIPINQARPNRNLTFTKKEPLG